MRFHEAKILLLTHFHVILELKSHYAKCLAKKKGKMRIGYFSSIMNNNHGASTGSYYIMLQSEISFMHKDFIIQNCFATFSFNFVT